MSARLCISWITTFILLIVGSATMFPSSVFAGKRYAKATGNWNTTATWSATSGGATGASIPSSSDTVYIGENSVAYTVTIPTSYAATCSAIFMGSSSSSIAATLSFAAATSSLVVTNDVFIYGPSNTATRSINVNLGSMTVNGDVSLSNGVSGTTTTRISKIVVTTGTLTVGGDILFNGIVSAQSVIDMSGGAGTLKLAGNINLNAEGTLTPGTTSKVTFNGTGSQSILLASSISYNSIEINKASGVAALSAITTLSGDVTLTAGTLSTNGYNLYVGGNWTNNGGALSNNTTAEIVAFYGVGKIISGTTNTNFPNLSVNTGSTISLQNSNTCSLLQLYVGASACSLTHTSTGNLTVNGDVIIDQPTAAVVYAWNINSGSATVTGNINIGDINTTTTRISKIVITTGTLTAKNIIFESSSTTAGTALIDMSGGAGRLNLSGSLTLTNGTGTITPGTTSTINYNGASAQTITFPSAIKFNDIFINNTVGVTLGAAVTSTNVTGDIRVQTGFLTNGGFAMVGAAGSMFEVMNGATFKMTGTSGMVTGFGTKTIGTTSTIDYAGTTQTVTSLTYGNLTLSGSGVKTLPGAFTIGGNFTMSGTASATAAGALTIGGDITLGSGTTFNASSYTHNLAGDFIDNGATFTPSTSTFNLNGTTSQLIGGTDASTSFNNLTIANITTAVTVNINTNVAGTLNMNGANTVLTPAATVVFNSSAAAGTITGTGTVQVTRLIATADYSSQYKFTTNTLTNLTIDYAGAGDQVVTGSTYSKLKISGSGSKVCSGALVVNGTLNIASGGTLDLATYTLTGTLTTLTGTGSLKTQNTSSTPIPVSKTWPFNIYYNSASAQTIVVGTYNNLDGSGGNRTLPSATVSLTGTFTSGSGTYTTTGNTIDYSSTSAQTIGAFAYNNLTLSGASTKTVGGSVTVVNTLTLGASTTLALGSNNITLQSDATNTARIAAVPTTASITYGTGRFIVERYVAGRRKYRLVTSSVTTSANSTLVAGEESLSIWGNWQNQGNNVTGNVGTLVTGGTSADGFDTQSSNASMYTYDAVNKKFIGFTSTNGKKTKYTPLKAGVAYYMFVYGDRLNAINSSTPNNTVLKATGTVLTGDQVYNTSSATAISSVTGNYTLVGNPFASAFDWYTVTKSNVSNVIYGWDPNLSSTGGYVSISVSILGSLISPVSTIVGVNQYIQPGQGFFVKTTGASPSFTIKESDKVATINNNSFRTAQPNSLPLMAVNLLYTSAGTTMLADGVLEAYDPSFSNNVTDDDAIKFAGSTETVSIVEEANLLSINARSERQAGDTMFLNLTKITRPQYTLQIFAQQLATSTAKPYLEDTYLNTSIPLSLIDTNEISFSVSSSDAASSASNRFRIVFKPMDILPITFTNIQASPKDKNIQVNWNVASEDGVTKYEIQHSVDGINFTPLATVNAKGSAGAESYHWLDVNPAKGNNYYQVRAVQQDGKLVLTKVVLVRSDAANVGLNVYPNPIKGQQINMELSAIETGKYTFMLFNAHGQKMQTGTIDYKGGLTSQVIQIDKKLTRGIYYLQVAYKNENYHQSLFIE